MRINGSRTCLRLVDIDETVQGVVNIVRRIGPRILRAFPVACCIVGVLRVTAAVRIDDLLEPVQFIVDVAQAFFRVAT